MTMHEQDELRWLAFRYVADELSPDEQSAFEGQLTENQAAREAVAEAVAMAAAVYQVAASDTGLRSPQRRPLASSRRSVGGAVALLTTAAAALMLLLAVQSRHSEMNAGRGIDSVQGGDLASSMPPGEYGRLALVWSQSLAEPPSAEHDSEMLETKGDPMEDHVAVDDWANPAELPAAPSWMYAAVMGLQGQDVEKESPPAAEPPAPAEQGI